MISLREAVVVGLENTDHQDIHVIIPDREVLSVVVLQKMSVRPVTLEVVSGEVEPES